jgi:hypothetical protein
LFRYRCKTNLSVKFREAVVATAFAFTSTGVVLFTDHPIATVSEVNNNVVVVPSYLDIVK